MSGWSRAHISEVPRFDAPGGDETDWRAVRHHLGIEAFGVNAWIGHRAGELVIEEHDELPGPGAGTLGHEELYFVSSGSARFSVGGKEFDAPAGTFVALRDPALVRRAVAAEDGTTVLAVGAPRGAAFDVSPWERRRVEGGAAQAGS